MPTVPGFNVPDPQFLVAGERRILEFIATRAPLSRTLDAICRLIDELSGLRSSIFLLDRSGERLTFAAGPHLPDMWRHRIASVPTTQTTCGVAVRERRQVISADIAGDPRFAGFHDAAQAAAIRAAWSTPFYSGYEHPIGTFAIYSDVPGEPSAAHLELVNRATHLASIAVEWHASEQALRESEIRFSRAFYANPASMSISTFPEGRVTYVNDAFVRLSGYSREEIIGQPATTLYVDPQQRTGLLDGLEGGAVRDVELQARHKSGEVFDVILSLERIDVLGARSVLAIAIDITDRKRAEEKLRRAEEHARSALDAIPVQIWSGPADGSVDYCNEKWRAYTGLGLPDVQGDGWQQMLHPDDKDRVITAWKYSVAAGAIYQQEERHRGADGSYRWFLCRGVPVRDAHDRIIRWYGANMDITDRKGAEDARTAAEEQLAQSRDHLRALAGRLMKAQDEERRRIAQLLHETTAQDVAGLKMILARLSRAQALSDVERELLAESLQLADRVMTESRTLSYLLHPPFLDEAGLVSAIRWYVEGFMKRSGVQVDLDVPETLQRLPRDVETTLFRVLQEALINIHHHAASLTAGVRLRTDATGLTLTVEDHGRGMSPDVIARFASDGSLVGVGIAGMRERLNQLGGTLEITSRPGLTTVRATIPLQC